MADPYYDVDDERRAGPPRRYEDRNNRFREIAATLLAFCGGLALLFLFFALIGAVDVGDATGLAIAALVFWLVTKLRESTRGDKVSFRPVEDLPADVQQSIDLALAKGKKITAIKLYRQATKAPLDAAKAAIDVREWKRG